MFVDIWIDFGGKPKLVMSYLDMWSMYLSVLCAFVCFFKPKFTIFPLQTMSTCEITGEYDTQVKLSYY
jgi:hypothetical protein